MITFDLSSIEIPTPQPYNPNDPLKNFGDLIYVGLQVLDRAKSAGVKLGGIGDLMQTIESFSASVLAAAGYRER